MTPSGTLSKPPAAAANPPRAAAASGRPALLEKIAPRPGARAVVGAALYECPTAGAVWAYHQAGLDWCWLDTEHQPNGEATIRSVAEVARRLGFPLLVRVPDVRAAPLSRPLDFGATGIIVPRVESAADAERAVRACHYPPAGCRGIGLPQRFCPDPGQPAIRQLDTIDRRTIVVVQIETAAGLAQADAIAAVPGLDAILFGPADMSISLGLGHQTEHPRVLDAMRRVADACARAGIAAGYHHDDTPPACQAAHLGFTLLSVGCDAGHLARGARQAAGLVAEACLAAAKSRG